MFTFIDNKKDLGFINNLVPKYENKNNNNITNSINIIEKIKTELVPTDIINNFIKNNIIFNNKTQKNTKYKNKKTNKSKQYNKLKELNKSKKYKMINTNQNRTKKNKSII